MLTQAVWRRDWIVLSSVIKGLVMKYIKVGRMNIFNWFYTTFIVAFRGPSPLLAYQIVSCWMPFAHVRPEVPCSLKLSHPTQRRETDEGKIRRTSASLGGANQPWTRPKCGLKKPSLKNLRMCPREQKNENTNISRYKSTVKIVIYCQDTLLKPKFEKVW
jgi:hypothetical protein